MIHYKCAPREQQLAELQDLYNSQQQLTVELSDKLEKTEVIIV